MAPGPKLAHVVGEVVGSSRVHVPRGINRVGWSTPVLMTHHRSGRLFFIPLAIVAEAKEILLVAAMTARGYVALNATQLAGLLSAAARAASHWPRPASDGWRGAPRSLLR